MAKIMVALSGGVDSSLTLALLHEQGHTLVGVTLHLWEGDGDWMYESQCCSEVMVEYARRVCALYDVPHYVFDYQREFRRQVIDYFVNEYVQGSTPNPCIACNRDVKFRLLLDRAQALGFDAVATGHYAQVRARSDMDGQTSYSLHRAADPAKDQSYVLYVLGQPELARLHFPIGGYTKAQVRAMAAERKLPSSNRPESQDICFVPKNNYRSFVQQEAPERVLAGPIFDRAGHELGQHTGLANYTIGQRKGLGIAVGEPLYVVDVDPLRNALIVGPHEATLRQSIQIDRLSFISGAPPTQPFECLAQVRAHIDPKPVQVTPQPDGTLHVQFNAPQADISLGQAAVLYNGEQVLGGGRIVAIA